MNTRVNISQGTRVSVNGDWYLQGRSVVHQDSQGTLSTISTCYKNIGGNRVAIPYTNVAKSSNVKNTAHTIFCRGYPVCHAKSYFSKSHGDASGNLGGVKSGTTEGKAEFISHAKHVFFEGIPAVRSGDLMVSNNHNTPPAPLMQKNKPLPKDLKEKLRI